MSSLDRQNPFDHAKRKAEQIEEIMKADPDGWRDAQIYVAEAYILLYLDEQIQKGSLERGRYNLLKNELRSLKDLQKIQDFMETYQVPELKVDFETEVLEKYPAFKSVKK